ncbi:MAG: hypothetical protein AB8F95_09325 [Bacteroidia bacterium]
MKSKRAIPILILLFITALAFSSCKMFKGDPRKNCNHPEHGKYMQQKRMKKAGL